MKTYDRLAGSLFGRLGSPPVREAEVHNADGPRPVAQWRRDAMLPKMDPRRILAVRLDNIGDLVMLGPALRALREAFPRAEITLLTSPAGWQAVSLLPWVDHSIVCRALWQDLSEKAPVDPTHEIALIDELREHQFQMAIIFTSFSQSPFPAAYACYMAGIPHRLGFSKEFGGNVLSLSPAPPADHVHQVERNLRLLEQLMPHPVRSDHLQLEVPDAVQRSADELLASVGVQPGMPFVALVPGASCATRRYDAGQFAAATYMLAMRTTLPLLILGNSREGKQTQPVADVANTISGVHSLVGRTTVPEFAAIIRRASLMIGGNSAAMHIADAFKCPMVILYSGSDLIEQWQPRHAPARLLTRPVHCSPCYNFDCPYQMECLDIRPQEVVAAALEMLTGRFHTHVPQMEIKAVS